MINSKGQKRTKWNSFVDWYHPYKTENWILQTLIENGRIFLRIDEAPTAEQLIEAGLVVNISPYEDLIELVPT